MDRMFRLCRRRFLIGIGGGTATVLASGCGTGRAEAKAFPVHHSETEWRRRLTVQQFRILRKEGTERAFSSPLDKEKRKGLFLCAGCANELFASSAKFDSETGWPSFSQPLPEAVGISRDYKLGYPRTAVHCADCGGHLGHVFDDGPKPAGKRYCMNGAAMQFRPV